MAKKTTTSALLISMIIIMASLSSLSHALVLNGLQISAVHVTGVLHCSLNGDQNAPVLSGVTVHLVCEGSSTDIARADTGRDGAFNIMTGILGVTNFDIQKCFIRINLPVASCAVFPGTGLVTYSLSLLNVVTSTVGNIACVAIVGPIRIG